MSGESGPFILFSIDGRETNAEYKTKQLQDDISLADDCGTGEGSPREAENALRRRSAALIEKLWVVKDMEANISHVTQKLANTTQALERLEALAEDLTVDCGDEKKAEQGEAEATTATNENDNTTKLSASRSRCNHKLSCDMNMLTMQMDLMKMEVQSRSRELKSLAEVERQLMLIVSNKIKKATG